MNLRREVGSGKGMFCRYGRQERAVPAGYDGILADRNYGCFLVAASSFCSIALISGLDMKFFQTSPVR
jgi:hypothetical protein